MPMSVLHNISLPNTVPGQLDQDQAYFLLKEEQHTHRVRFHDYDQIYRRAGLYEQLFYQRLQCVSPRKAEQVLRKVLADNQQSLAGLRVLDLGAGNGMVGELLDAARIVGVDILDEAREACERDRPHAYDAYFVLDMDRLTAVQQADLQRWRFNCLTCIAALGFGDIPASAFRRAYQLIEPQGWLVFNIKETFLRPTDSSGFSKLVKTMMTSDVIEVHHLERYQHRVSIDGQPLYYYMMVARKVNDLPQGLS